MCCSERMDESLSMRDKTYDTPSNLSMFVLLSTCSSDHEFIIECILGESDYHADDCSSLEEIYNLLLLALEVRLNQCITSNTLEVFNALYDRSNIYKGRKSL